jgi:hypothetical protein
MYHNTAVPECLTVTFVTYLLDTIASSDLKTGSEVAQGYKMLKNYLLLTFM